MPIKNTAVTVTILVWDFGNNCGKTGQEANITLRAVGDLTEFTPSLPAIAEVDATNRKGEYLVTLIAAENNYDVVSVGGILTVAVTDCEIIPTRWVNDQSSVRTTQVLLTGTASAGSSTTITLTGGTATAGLYDGCLCVITAGTGAGQARTILSYAASTVATVTRNWAVAPGADSVFHIYGGDIPAILEAGTATAGSASNITLDAGASTISGTYKDNVIMITAGTGIGQARIISAYNGGTLVATVTPAWTTQPDLTSVYQILPQGRVDVGIWLGSTVATPGVTGVPKVDLTYINSAAQTATLDTIKAETALIVADTNELQGLISDSKIASQVKGMDADVLTASALKADAINEITAAIWAKVVDGTITFATMSKILLAFTAGKVIITANSFAFYDQSNVLLFTLPITTAGRIPVIA